jgi:hypothetical protein
MSLLGLLSLGFTRLDRKQHSATPFPAFELISLLRQAIFANCAADVAPDGRDDRPGRVTRLTGISAAGAELAAKSLELTPDSVCRVRAARAFWPMQMIRGSDELDGAYAAIVREHAALVVAQPSLLVELTIDLALKYRLPPLSILKSDVQAGCLASYSLRRRAGFPNRSLCGQDLRRSDLRRHG